MNRVVPQEIAGEVTMLRTSWNGPIMLVEGPSDVQFFEGIYDNSIMRVIPALGWQNVVEAKRLLDDWRVSDVLCVIDLDYRSALNQLPSDPDTFTTDFHDLEIMMVESRAFQKVLRENGSKAKIQRWPGGVNGIKKHAYGLAFSIGALRFHSGTKNLGLCFDEMHFKKFIDKKAMSFKANAFIDHLRGKWPPNKEITIGLLEEAMKSYSDCVEFTDHSHLCCGHDVAEIVAIGLRSTWGTSSGREYTGAQIESMLRLAYSKEDFSSTILAQKIGSWFERRNSPNA